MPKVYHWPGKPDEPMSRAAIKWLSGLGLRYADLEKPICWKCKKAETFPSKAFHPIMRLQHRPHCIKCADGLRKREIKHSDETWRRWELSLLQPNRESLRMYVGQLREDYPDEAYADIGEIIQLEAIEIKRIRKAHRIPICKPEVDVASELSKILRDPTVKPAARTAARHALAGMT